MFLLQCHRERKLAVLGNLTNTIEVSAVNINYPSKNDCVSLDTSLIKNIATIDSVKATQSNIPIYLTPYSTVRHPQHLLTQRFL